jgi:hypothetical protein
MKKQQTNHTGNTNKMVMAVDWLINELEEQNLIKLDKNKTVLFSKNFATRYELIIHEAKEMEKEQIKDAYFNSASDILCIPNGIKENAEKYYKETYEN